MVDCQTIQCFESNMQQRTYNPLLNNATLKPHLRYWACSSQHHPTNCTSNKKRKKKHPYPMTFMYFRSLLLSPPNSSLQTWKLIMSWVMHPSLGLCRRWGCLPKLWGRERTWNSFVCHIYTYMTYMTYRVIISGGVWRSEMLKPPHIGRSYQFANPSSSFTGIKITFSAGFLEYIDPIVNLVTIVKHQHIKDYQSIFRTLSSF